MQRQYILSFDPKNDTTNTIMEASSRRRPELTNKQGTPLTFVRGITVNTGLGWNETPSLSSASPPDRKGSSWISQDCALEERGRGRLPRIRSIKSPDDARFPNSEVHFPDRTKGENGIGSSTMQQIKTKK